MTSEFTAHCNHYYNLTQLLFKRHDRFENLLNNAPLYSGQTRLSEVDAIINYYREVQAYKAKMEKTMDDMKKTERIILMIMRHFEIPPGTVLTGQIPGEVEYELWANKNDMVYVHKTKDLQAEEKNPNSITIKLWRAGDGEED